MRAICGCGPAGGTRPQIEARDGGDGFSGVRAASLGRPAELACAVRAVLIYEVRAVRHSFDCGLQRLAPLGATLNLRSQRPEPSAALHLPYSKYGGSTCGLSPLPTEWRLSAPSLSQRHSLSCVNRHAASLFLCRCVRTGGQWGVRAGSEAATSSVRGVIEDRVLRACVVCVCGRVPTLQTRTAHAGVRALILARLLVLCVCR